MFCCWLSFDLGFDQCAGIQNPEAVYLRVLGAPNREQQLEELDKFTKAELLDLLKLRRITGMSDKKKASSALFHCLASFSIHLSICFRTSLLTRF